MSKYGPRIERSTPTDPDYQRLTPVQLAEYMQDGGSDHARKTYLTYGQLWDDHTAHAIGLLTLIFEELGDLNRRFPNFDMMAGHATWLRFLHARAGEALEAHAKQRTRISEFCDPSLLGDDALCYADIHSFSHRFRIDFAIGPIRVVEHFLELHIIPLELKVERLKSVKSLDDLENLCGIGKVKAQRIREQFAKRGAE